MCFTGLTCKDCINTIWEHSGLEYHDISMKSCAALIRPCIHLCLMIVSLFILYDIMLLQWILYLYFTQTFSMIYEIHSPFTVCTFLETGGMWKWHQTYSPYKNIHYSFAWLKCNFLIFHPINIYGTGVVNNTPLMFLCCHECLIL